MAVSKGFFNLRRGSTKSLTFSVLDGKQITKDRVTSVTNPRTEAQASQRMRMVGAKNFYRAFNDLLNHSFEGKKVGLQNYNEFVKNALKSNAGPYVPKGSNVFTPAAYLMAKGSLQAQTCAIKQVENSRSALFGKLAVICNSIVAPAETDMHDYGEWEALNPWLKEGDQITFIYVTKIKGAEGELANYTPYMIRGYMKQVDYERSKTQKSVDFIVRLEEARVTIGANAESAQGALVFGEKTKEGIEICAGAVIISRGDASRTDPWMRSTSQMAISEELEGTIHSEEAYSMAIKTYMAGDKSVTSNLYLNGSADATITRVAAILLSGLSGDASKLNGTRALIGHDATGAKYAITHEDGSAVAYDGGKIVYTGADEQPKTLMANDVPAMKAMRKAVVTGTQIAKLLA